MQAVIKSTELKRREAFSEVRVYDFGPVRRPQSGTDDQAKIIYYALPSGIPNTLKKVSQF